MGKFAPDMYVKDILSINYNKLKKKGIKVLLFDFDNTIIAHKIEELDKDYLDKIKSLKKDFDIYIISNSFNSKRLKNFSKELDIPYIGRSLKPLGFGYKKLKLDINPNSIAMIGDQMITDIWGSNRMGYYSILIDPIDRKTEVIFTKINRKLEELFIEKINKVKRGNYYD